MNSEGKPPDHRGHQDPMTGQNFSHLSGSPTARLPDSPPQLSDLHPSSTKTRIISSTIIALILLGVILWLILT